MKKRWIWIGIIVLSLVITGCSSFIMSTPDKRKEEKASTENTRKEIRVTIPEGYHVRQIAELLEKKGVTTKEEFLEVAKAGDFDYWFLADVPMMEDERFYRLEGFLFPDTYYFYENTPAREVANKMLGRFDYVISKYKEDILKKEYSLYDIIRLASVVEREAKVEEERPIIAGVFYNRIELGMKLQSCATVQYLFDEPKPTLYYSDLEIDSPYNTYRYSGLPIGPISNPGEQSIKASLYPEKTEYLYFVAKGDTGSHEFAKTYEEHQQNINKVRD